MARAEELATAMAVRGYGQTMEKQTLKQMHLSTVDRVSIAVIFSWCILLLWLFGA
jgi:energy-coupling factor transporter transmembrane protein EcfT